VWLDPLLEAIAKSAGRLAIGDQARFMTDVAKELGQPETSTKEKASAPASHAQRKPEPAAHGTSSPRTGRHPAGERDAKRQSALAENLRKWLAGRKDNED
jgi:PTH1 family peptidyl-tRNA hydrolase